MINKLIYLTGLLTGIFLLFVQPLSAASPALPSGIQWLTNNEDPPFASEKAQKGGTLHLGILSFPLTFRIVGPDSNTIFRDAVLNNQLELINLHPNTENIIPGLATHWAFGKDKKSMFFKLNPKARWSDGHPVTADDFVFTLEFMRSKHIVAPWYNDYYTREIEKVVVYDKHTLAIVGTRAMPDLHLRLPFPPTPRHYYGKLEDDFVKRYNWEIVPNTGPYQIADFKKGKYIKFKRKKSWWAKDLRYFKNRFNVDYVVYDVVKDHNIMWEFFKKQRLGVFDLKLPDFWHVKSKVPVVQKGYIHKIWFFNDIPRSAYGLWLNMDRPIFKDQRIRYAFAHAMNIERVIEKVLRKDYYRLEQGFMGYGDYSDNAIKARRYDLKKVTKLMDAAGWKRGEDGIWQKEGTRFSVVVTYGTAEHTPSLVVLKEEAKKAGVELRLELLDPASSYKKVMEKKQDVNWGLFGTSLRPQYWGQFHSLNAHKSQTNNITNTDDPEMDQLIDAYRNSLEASQRMDLSKKIQLKIHEMGCFVPSFMIPFARQAYWRWWQLPDTPGTKISENLFSPFNATTGGLFWFNHELYNETKSAIKRRKRFKPVTIIDNTYQIESLQK
ncbi:MAG: extracellular solute-binding protein [Desulfobacteraceae bacterium]|jgi:microcin C transport system substrate-binding protein